MSNTYGAPPPSDPRINAQGVQPYSPIGTTPPNLTQLYNMLQQRNKKPYQISAPAPTGWGKALQAIAPAVDAWGQRSQLEQLMGGMQQQGQQNASLLLGDSGGGGGTPSMPPAQGAAAPPMPGVSPQMPSGAAIPSTRRDDADWEQSLKIAQDVINSGPPPPGGSTMGGQPGATYSQVMGGARNVAGMPGATTGATGGEITPASAGGAAPAASSPAGAQPPAGATANAFGPQTGTFVNPADLPGRVQRDWPAIMRQLPTMLPQQQQDLIKEFQETAGGKNPLSFKIPNGAGTVFYHPSNPSQQQLIPDIQKEERADVSGNKRPFEFVITPSGEKKYREAPPSEQELVSGAGKLEETKKLAESNVKTFETVHAGMTGAAQTAAFQKQNISVIRQAAANPNFMSGVGEQYNLIGKQLIAQFGLNPSAAAPQEIVSQALGKILNDQFSGMRQLTEAGGENAATRIFQAMLTAEQKSLPSKGDSTEGLLQKIDNLDRTGDLFMILGDKADAYKKEHGRLDTDFLTQTRKDVADWGRNYQTKPQTPEAKAQQNQAISEAAGGNPFAATPPQPGAGGPPPPSPGGMAGMSSSVSPVVQGQQDARGMIDKAIQKQLPNYQPQGNQPTFMPLPAMAAGATGGAAAGGMGRLPPAALSRMQANAGPTSPINPIAGALGVKTKSDWPFIGKLLGGEQGIALVKHLLGM
jgi:hypothetical protein